MANETLTPLRRDFYVYVWYRANGTPCYVGKGHGDRFKRHARKSSANTWLRRIFAKDGEDMRCELVEISMAEGESHELERFLIAEIGRRDNGGPLVNMTDGGEGACGLRHSESTKRKMSQRKLGKPRGESLQPRQPRKFDKSKSTVRRVAIEVGQKFGRLTIVRPLSVYLDTTSVWHCQCDCGEWADIAARSLLRGTKSCGCLQRDITRSRRHWLPRDRSGLY